MTNSEYFSVWKLLTNHQFHFDISKCRDLICIQCRCILKNAHRSLCDCSYCYNCFFEYYTNDAKFCPGKIDNCHTTIATVLKYLRFDKEKNDRIMELTVVCPTENCYFKDTLKNMDNHVKSHGFVNQKNELSDNEAVEINTQESTIDSDAESHDYDNSVWYFQDGKCKTPNNVSMVPNIINCVDDYLTDSSVSEDSLESPADIYVEIKNEVTTDSDSGNTETDDFKRIKVAVHRMKNDIEDMKFAKKSLNEEVNHFRRKCDETHMDMAEVKQQTLGCIGELREKIEKLTTDNDKYQIENDKLAFDLECLTQNMKEQQNKQVQLKELVTKLYELFEEKFKENPVTREPTKRSFQTEFQEPMAKIPKLILGQSADQPIKSHDDDIAPIDWRIGEISQKMRDAADGVNPKIYSNPFYTHPRGYRMRLVLYPNGFDYGLNTHLSVGFAIMKGQYDDELLWPMRHEVVVSLVDQTSRRNHSVIKYKYNAMADNIAVYQRPVEEINRSFGFYRFILKHVLNDPRIVENDSILIGCCVDRPISIASNNR